VSRRHKIKKKHTNILEEIFVIMLVVEGFSETLSKCLNIGKLSHDSRLMSKGRLLAIRNPNRAEIFLLYKAYAFDLIINRAVDMYSIGLILFICSINLSKPF
jgi:hypothetical protein